jgi:hypothetical protein
MPPKPSSRPNLAADILKLKRPQISGSEPTISLEKEVDQYLSNPNEGTGILQFWQVSLNFINYAKLIIY